MSRRVVQVRLVGPPEAVDVAEVEMVAKHGDAWQPGRRKPGRDSGDHIRYGTLLVDVSAHRM